MSIVFSNNERAVLKAKKTGTSTITAQIGNKKLTCKVTVKKQKGIPKKMTVIKGDKVTFKQNKKKGTWKSSNTAIAKVAKKKSASKKVTFKALGTVVISEKIGKKTYKCANEIYFPQTYKLINGLEVTDSDLVFYYDKTELAKFFSPLIMVSDGEGV